MESAAVVGVVRDVRDRGLEVAPEPTVYSVGSEFRRTRYVARVAGDPRDYEAPIRRAIARVNADAVIEPAETIQARLAGTIRRKAFATLVLAFFGVAGGAVTLGGLVGMVTFVVGRRTREIAIRMAIGAQRSHIRWLVVREAVTSAVVGGLAGLLAGRWLSTWLESFVFGIEAGNWTTAIVGAGGAMLVMIVTALVPARRAVSLQPTEALRVE
jgi:predicted lysophospholipase L1 biosynthesis ABC-type transport system permease subunit